MCSMRNAVGRYRACAAKPGQPGRRVRPSAGLLRLPLLVVAASAIALTAAGLSGPSAPAGPPPVNPGRPTLTDPASLTAPGWLEAEIGLQRALKGDLQLQTPLTLKLTAPDRRLEYRLATSGYTWQRDPDGGHTDGLGDTFVSLHYLVTQQGAGSWDTAIRGTVKLPTASARRGLGTGRPDYGLLALASRDLSPSLHVDANLAYTALSRSATSGQGAQLFASASATLPLRRSRWAYTNEIAWQSASQDQRLQLTTMHGLSYAARPWDVRDVAVNVGLSSGTPACQVLFGRTFLLSRLF
jgi:hypothetical protein